MDGAAVVPDHDVALLPFVAVVAIRAGGTLREVGDDRIAFGWLKTDNAHDLAVVEVKRLAAGFRMHGRHRMNRRCAILVFFFQSFLLAFETPAVDMCGAAAFELLLERIRCRHAASIVETTPVS